eukprot:scaffold58903_cov38-Cyclotella_meneghiniana.AAC.1
MDSTLKWNTTCEAYATYAELVAAALIIEESVIELTPPKLPGDTNLDVVHVYELCGVFLDHGGTTVDNDARRLQLDIVLTTDVKMYQYVSKKCITECSEQLFHDADNALYEIVDDGSLTKSVQDNSEGLIKAAFNPNGEDVDSGYVTVTASPTVTPGSPSSSPSSRPSRTPITFSPVTSSPTAAPFACGLFEDPCSLIPDVPEGTCCLGFTCNENTFVCDDGEDGPGSDSPTASSPVTSRPTNRPTLFPTASKASKQSKSAKPTPSPVTPKPTPAPATPRPTAAKTSKYTKRRKLMGETGLSL